MLKTKELDKDWKILLAEIREARKDKKYMKEIKHLLKIHSGADIKI